MEFYQSVRGRSGCGSQKSAAFGLNIDRNGASGMISEHSRVYSKGWKPPIILRGSIMRREMQRAERARWGPRAPAPYDSLCCVPLAQLILPFPHNGIKSRVCAVVVQAWCAAPLPNPGVATFYLYHSYFHYVDAIYYTCVNDAVHKLHVRMNT